MGAVEVAGPPVVALVLIVLGVVAVAAGVVVGAAQGVAHRPAQVPLAPREEELERMIGRVRVGEPHLDHGVALVGPEEVRVGALGGGQGGVGGQGLERRLIDVGLAELVLALAPHVADLAEDPPGQGALHAHAPIPSSRGGRERQRSPRRAPRGSRSRTGR